MGISDEIRRRLERLNRQPLREEDEATGDRAELQAAIVYPRDAVPLPRRAASDRLAGLAHVRLDDVVAGASFTTPSHGAAFEVRRAGAELSEHEPEVGRRFIREGWRDIAASVTDVGQNGGLPAPEDLLFMDIETTGLGCAQVFLIGVMAWTVGGFEVRQYLARSYAEEPAIVARFAEDVAASRLLVSFNGKSFDMPNVRARAAVHRVPLSVDLPHLDLLHAARRAWKRRMPDCRLQTLETRVCGRPRLDDLPGSEIPDAYREYVRTGNAVEVVRIIEHNARDLLTLADILTRLPGSEWDD